MLSLSRKGPGWEIITDRGSVELRDEQARAIASRILAEEGDAPVLDRRGRTESLSRKVVRLVQEDIACGFFQLGQRLDEVFLANRYGVSRTPVREALMELAVVGVVTREAHKGCRVAVGVAELVHVCR